MHKNAKQWDMEVGHNGDLFTGGPWNGPPPQNRPCDWCGEKVDVGFIHPECAVQERERWLDILY